jgi:hypothetical protein
VDVEVVRGGAQRVADHATVLRRDVLDGQPHVRRQLAAAAAAERVPDGLVEIAAGALPFLREIGHLLPGQLHFFSIPASYLS